MKQKKDLSGVNQLQRDLESGHFAPFYLFYGEEVYLRDEYLSNLKKAVLPPGAETFNFHEFQGKEMSAEKLEETLDGFPMMAERTFVIVTDWDVFKLGETVRTALIEIFSNLPDYCTLVFLYDLVEYKGDARTKLAMKMAEVGVFVNFPRLSQGDLVRWIQNSFGNMGKEISGAVATDLIFYCGDYMTKLSGEMEKIAAYAPEKQVRKEDIHAVAMPHIEAVVFEMTDAMGAGNFDLALKVLSELYQMQEHPLMIMKVVTRMIRQVYGAKLVMESGRGQGEVAKLFGLKPYPAQKVMESARRFSLPWCREACLKCAKTDLAMKSSGVSEQELLTQLVLELANG